MATFTLTVLLDAPSATPVVATVTTADTNTQHLLDWAASVYFPLGVLVSGQVGGTGSFAPVYRAPTSAEILQARFSGMWVGEAANVNNYLEQQAKAAAAAAAPVVS